MVNITVRVLSRPNENNLANIYRELGTDFDERVLPSIVNEVLKGVTAQFNASQLISELISLYHCSGVSLTLQLYKTAQREMVSRLIRESLSRRAVRFGLVLDDVCR